MIPEEEVLRLFDASGNPQGLAAVDGYLRYSDTYAGLGAGFNLSPTLRLGASLFMLYSTLDQSTGTVLADEQTATGIPVRGPSQAGSANRPRR